MRVSVRQALSFTVFDSGIYRLLFVRLGYLV
jgi:hypothetical protein